MNTKKNFIYLNVVMIITKNRRVWHRSSWCSRIDSIQIIGYNNVCKSLQMNIQLPFVFTRPNIVFVDPFEGYTYEYNACCLPSDGRVVIKIFARLSSRSVQFATSTDLKISFLLSCSPNFLFTPITESNSINFWRKHDKILT